MTIAPTDYRFGQSTTVVSLLLSRSQYSAPRVKSESRTEPFTGPGKKEEHEKNFEKTERHGANAAASRSDTELVASWLEHYSPPFIEASTLSIPP
jgi:hypothetical protein